MGDYLAQWQSGEDGVKPLYIDSDRGFIWGGAMDKDGYSDDVASESCGPVFEFFGCWFDLYKQMDDKELLYLNSIMKSLDFNQDECVVTQGVTGNRLYFINHGTMKTVVMEKGARIEGKELGMGDLAGVEGFFENKPSPYSVISGEGSRVDYIDKKDLTGIKKHEPGLYAKLRDYCLNHRIRLFANSSVVEKRQNPRYSLPGLTAAKLIDTLGIPEGKPFRGELLDVSEGGFAFTLKISKKKDADKLIGRNVMSLIKIKGDKPCNDIFWGGQIVNVCKRNKDMYSIHLKGDGVSYPMNAYLRSLETFS